MVLDKQVVQHTDVTSLAESLDLESDPNGSDDCFYSRALVKAEEDSCDAECQFV